jgi:hypothetical protein
LRRLALIALWTQVGCLDAPPGSPGPAATPHSVQFFGQSFRDNGVDRVWIPAERPSPAGQFGHDNFTLELWLKVEADAVPERDCGSPWYQNTIVLDREFYVDPPQNGNIGLAVYRTAAGSGVAAGFEVQGADEVNLCGDAPVADGRWHHIAVTRAPDNPVSIWVDGDLDESGIGPAGDGSVAQDIVTDYPGDRFMVLGGPKHEPDVSRGFAGLIDDLRLSDDDLYDTSFEPPYPPLAIDPDDTMALWSFDEGQGTTAAQLGGDVAADAELRVGGDPAGPIWSDDVPRPENRGYFLLLPVDLAGAALALWAARRRLALAFFFF